MERIRRAILYLATIIAVKRHITHTKVTVWKQQSHNLRPLQTYRKIENTANYGRGLIPQTQYNFKVRQKDVGSTKWNIQSANFTFTFLYLVGKYAKPAICFVVVA